MQHGFTEDNLNELQFAVFQMQRESEVANSRYVQIVDQILREFLAAVEAGPREVDAEVSWLTAWQVYAPYLTACMFLVGRISVCCWTY